MNYIHNNLSKLIIIYCLVTPFTNILSQSKFKNSSQLADGEIYKIGIEESGIYKLDYGFFKDQLKIDIDNIASNTIKVLGNRGGALPEIIADSYEDGLQEHHIYIQDGNDGKINPGDFILFYGEGASIWKFDEKDLIHHKPKNIYDNQNYYFIKISSESNNKFWRKIICKKVQLWLLQKEPCHKGMKKIKPIC